MEYVRLNHLGLSPPERMRIRAACSKGWYLAEGTAKERSLQKDAWFLTCLENRHDFVFFEWEKKTLWLEADKTASTPLSAIFRHEYEEFKKSWKLKEHGMRLKVPENADVEALAEAALEVYRRDRTPQRDLELQASAFEGMGEALKPDEYWENVEEGETVYVYIIPIEDRPGRCVVLRHQCLSLVDVPLRDFRLCPTE